MKVIICRSKKEMELIVASVVVREIKRKSNLVLGLATGETMIGFYRTLISLYRKNRVSFSRVRTFNLDEYVGVGRKDKTSYWYYMDKNFFRKVDINEKNVYFLDGLAKNGVKECKDYEKNIDNMGGIDLQILGIGENGHIGFNEPGSSFISKTREVVLSEDTRKVNSRFFSDDFRKVPKRAMTMGIGTIMDSKKIILLASGSRKAKAVYEVLRERISRDVPASVLRKHKNVNFILHKSAAQIL